MLYQFGPYSLDVDERRLHRGSQLVPLEPRAFDVLGYLVHRAGKLVDKQELFTEVWSGQPVGDNSLTRCVHQIRERLGDNSATPVYLETVRGSGYRFIAEVRELSDRGQVRVEANRARRLQRMAGAAVFGLLLVLLGSWVVAKRGLVADEQVSYRIAVLPFENFSDDIGQDYFVDGVHEALIGELSHIEEFDVISRSSVMAFSGGEFSLADVAEALDVDTIVEGSVSKSGDSLSVSVRLIQVDPERNLWAGRFHRDIANVFEITTGIARAIADEVSIELSESEEMLLTPGRRVEPRAFDRYLLGLTRHRENPPASSVQALDLFREAITLDPGYADAYVGLADAIGAMIVFGVRSPAEDMPTVRQLTGIALDLDSTLASAHRLNASVSFYGAWDVDAAEVAAGRALALDPSFAGAYSILAEVYAVSGRGDEALDAIQRARALDPTPPVSRFKPALIHYLLREFSEAQLVAARELGRDPHFWQGHWLLCVSSSALGLHAQAIEACESAAGESRRAPMALGALGLAHARAGERAAARRILDELESLRKTRYVGAVFPAMVYGALGEPEAAMAQLRRAYEEGDVNLVYIGVAEYLDSLRGEPDFEAIAERIVSAP